MSLKSLGLFVPLKNESASGWCITAACLSLIWCRLAGVVCARAEKGYSREHKKSLHFNMRARQWERNSSSAALLFYLIAVSAWRRADLWLLSWCESCCGLLLKHSISALHLTPLRARRDHRSRMIYNYNTNFESGRPFLLALDFFYWRSNCPLRCSWCTQGRSRPLAASDLSAEAPALTNWTQVFIAASQKSKSIAFPGET
jgi:hypothetical protein